MISESEAHARIADLIKERDAPSNVLLENYDPISYEGYCARIDELERALDVDAWDPGYVCEG